MQKTQRRGFTIIEVVLVLAIAGLIFLMVFLAFPALQKNQRDTQRRQDSGQFISQLQSYRTDNKGRLPTTAQRAAFVAKYLPDWKDPLTDATYTNPLSATPGSYDYVPGEDCAGVARATKAYIRMTLESGETCQDL
jgi:prepilin-type N-terminal cleavage/methylation domain-containing protein